MPASSGDPISAAVNSSLAASSKFSLDSDTLENKLIGSAKRVLLTEIQYEQTSSYSSNLSVLKSKYIVLKPTSSSSATSEDCDTSLKNCQGSQKPSGSDVLKSIFDHSSSSTESKSSSGSKLVNGPSSISNSLKSDSVLPSPKRVLFSPEKIQLGWQSKNQPIGSGMMNMGNTCYLNSTLQALFHVPAFVNWLLNDKAHKEKCETMNGCIHNECIICAVYKTLKSSMENSAASNPIQPRQVYSKLKMICKRLVHGHQEDAHEFLRYLIESMEKSYLRIMNANNLDSYSKETTPLSQIFGGYFRTEVKCLECRHISVTFQHFQDLLLDIRQVDTLDEALEAYFSCERLGVGEEAYKCDKCHRRVAATKQYSVEKPPNVLCIQLKRFGIMGGKNSKHIQVQQSLDLTKYWVHHSGQPNTRLNYRLVSLVSHIGPSANCGHYTAIGMTSSGQLYLFDDSMVRPISSHNVSGNNTYIIMYELTRPVSNPSSTPTGTPTKVATNNCTVTKPSSHGASGGINGHNPFAKNSSSSFSPSSALTNGGGKSSQPSSPLKIICNSHSSSPSKASLGTSPCTKSSSGSRPSHTSLVPYTNESSDSESETPAKHKSPAPSLKNGFAKESSSSVKYSNSGTVNGVSVSGSAGQSTLTLSAPVVNGWHVTESETKSEGKRSLAVYSPPQNWDVEDAPESKFAGKSEDLNPPKTSPYFNGINSKDSHHKKSLENGVCSTNSTKEESTPVTNGNRVYENGRITNGNGKSWDGNRNGDTVEFLKKNSHQGYGSNVATWNGGRTLVDREAENDRFQQRKRGYDQNYDEEFDQGKVKKVKSNNHHYQKNGDRDVHPRHNYFQEQQNYKNYWHNKNKARHQNNNNNFYRTYSNNHGYNRSYQNNRFHWRR